MPSYEEAQWFQSLPEKVQKNNFTPEEQRVLAKQRNSFLLEAAAEVAQTAHQQAQRKQSEPAVQTSHTSLSSSISSVHTLEERASVAMDESILSSFRWMDDEEDLDLTLGTYPKQSLDPKSDINPGRHSFRRSISLTALTLGDSPSPTASRTTSRTMVPSPLPIPSQRDLYERNVYRSCLANPLPKHYPSASQSTLDQSTKHYQDPEARLKLRVCLGDPSKFDETLEFGFPSLTNTPSESSDRPSLSRSRHTEPTPQTFFNDDLENSSFLDGLSDSESLSEVETPHTPSDTFTFRNTHRLPTSKSSSKPTSTDMERPYPSKAASAPRILKSTVEHPQQQQYLPYENTLGSTGGNREMTLRMTLTRADLRARESLLYPNSTLHEQDPLALDHLPIGTTLGTDAWEQQQAKEEGVVKKFWRRVRRRSQGS